MLGGAKIIKVLYIKFPKPIFMSQRDFTRGGIAKHLLCLSWPLTLSLLLVMVMHLIEIFCVSKLGTLQLAVLGFAGPVISLLHSLAIGIGSGVSSKIALSRGQEDKEMVKTYATVSFILALLISLFFSILGFTTSRSIFNMLGASEEIIAIGSFYMKVWYAGNFLMISTFVGVDVIRASGDCSLPGKIILATALSYVLLVPSLIFGLFGLPKLGLGGAALGAILAYGITFFFVFYEVVIKLKLITLRHSYDDVLKAIKNVIKLAIPAAGSSIITPVATAFATSIISNYGEEVVGAYNAAIKIENMAMSLIIALAGIMTPFVGQNFGANKNARIIKAANLAFCFNIFWSMLIGLVLFFYSKSLISLISPNPTVQATVEAFFKIISVSLPFLGWTMIVGGIANGQGNALPGLFMTVMRLLIIFPPLCLYLEKYYQTPGVFVAFSIANIIIGIYAYFWGKKKLNHHLA
jgi:putative MATE family efflux protein